MLMLDGCSKVLNVAGSRTTGGKAQTSLLLNIEHRAAPSTDRLQLALKDNPPALALELVEQAPTAAPNQPSSRQRIEQILAAAKAPVTQRQLRNAARMRASHVADILAQMIESGRVS